MIESSSGLRDGDVLDCDICIVGAGPAGIALARELSSSSQQIVLLESGGFAVENEFQDLNIGTTEGLALPGMIDGRARAFGGAGRLWAGQCMPFEDIDFEGRDWVRKSGWPVDSAVVSTYLDRAAAFFRVEGEVYDARNYDLFGLHSPVWNESKLSSVFTVYTPDVDVGETHALQLRSARNVRVLLHSTVVEALVEEGTKATTGVSFRTGKGTKAEIRAPVVVLAAGGLENARILLLSRSVEKNGLGNRSGLVGRFFQDHPNGITATITPNVDYLPDIFRLLYKKDKRYFPKFTISDEVQRQHRVLNANAHLVFNYPSDSGVAALQEFVRAFRKRSLPRRPIRALWNVIRNAPEVIDTIARRVKGVSPKTAASTIQLQCYSEQEPDPDNRITLDVDNRDRFGLPRLKVHWDVGEIEKRTLLTITNTVADEFERLGLGTVHPARWLASSGDAWKAHISDCNHHAGTTRMAKSADDGVVDCDGQVFGVPGLYITGGSIFPTSGYANPTLMIVALAIRLADHLKAQTASR